MILGKDFTQPDKASGFGYELIIFYKINSNERYLNAAIDIANTLAKRLKKGDNDNSSLPFKVNAKTVKVGVLIETVNGKKQTHASSYSSNWMGTLQLFQELQNLEKGNTALNKISFTILLEWMKAVPLKINKWGSFFEDVNGWLLGFYCYIEDCP